MEVPSETNQTNLEDLPSEVLLEIFLRLNSYDLLRLSETCRKLNNFVLKTKSLWTNVDFTGHPLDTKDFAQIIEYFHSNTVSIALEGFLSPGTSLNDTPCNVTGPMMTAIANTCTHLNNIKLVNVILLEKKIMIHHFPRTLK